MTQPLLFEAFWIGNAAIISGEDPPPPLGLRLKKAKRGEVVSLGDGLASVSLRRVDCGRKPHARPSSQAWS